jgi:3-hydroxybutyryl-CoA dehydrogenase
MLVKGIKNVAVIGAGTMGQGIAQVCAVTGYNVLLYDVRPEVVHSSILTISQNLQAAVEKGKLTPSAKESALKNITTVTAFEKLRVDLAIEAVVESLELKKKIFLQLEEINPPEAILVSNTSSIPITQIGSVLKYPGRFAGLHFFNPATVMKLVEIIKGVSTSEATASLLQSFAGSLSKESVLAQDSPGFIVNRVARHFYVESLKVFEEGGADFSTIDKLLKASGFKMGPFELMDLIGVDTNFSVTTSMFNAFHQDAKFRPSRIQQQKVDAGHHGRKSGKGFYDYSKK